MIASENGLLVVTVLLNVRGRDVGSLRGPGRARSWRRRCGCPEAPISSGAGSTRTKSGRTQRLKIVVPVVLLVIFPLAVRHLRLASRCRAGAPGGAFGLAGGVYILYALGYNFSVAVWVGFIALFEDGRQTAVVMVIYLDEAVGAPSGRSWAAR